MFVCGVQEAILRILLDVSRGMAAVHAAGLEHLDLKPGVLDVPLPFRVCRMTTVKCTCNSKAAHF